MIELVPQARIDEVWPLVVSGFAACLEKTPTNIGVGEFWQMCRSGNAFLLISSNGSEVISASVWRFEGAKFTCLLLSGKNSEKWVFELVTTAGIIAKSNGTAKLSASGRVGLGKMLNKNGVVAKVTRQEYEVDL